MKSFELIKKNDLKNIRLIIFDVDGVLVRRGTKISRQGSLIKFQIKKIGMEEVELIKKLHKKGFFLNVNSGRGLYFLQEMFRGVLSFLSLTYENGSASWIDGKIYQHVNCFKKLNEADLLLREIKDIRIKGFEPKEFIISVHCKRRVEKIEKLIKTFRGLYCIWNGEAYDIGIKNLQTKTTGLKFLMNELKLRKENVFAIGDNFNDVELLRNVGISVCADKGRIKGDFFVPLHGEYLPANLVMKKILEVS